MGPGKRGYRYEAQDVIEAGLATKHQDVVIVRVAKSNFHDVDRAKRVLVRQEGGIFEDVTHLLPQRADINTDAPDEPAVRRGQERHSDESLAIGTDAVWELILAITAEQPEGTVSSNQLSKCLAEWKDKIPGLAKVVKAGTTRNGGGPRVGAVNWHLERLCETGRLASNGARFVVVDGSGPAASC